jgi:hypothetical protein
MEIRGEAHLECASLDVVRALYAYVLDGELLKDFEFMQYLTGDLDARNHYDV